MESQVRANERLAEVVSYLILSEQVKNKTDFANKIGKHKSVVSDYINGRQNVSEIFLRRVSDIFTEVNWKWIQTGEGEMLRNTSSVQNNTISTGANSVATIDNSVTNGADVSEAEYLKRKVEILEERLNELKEQLSKEKERSASYWDVLRKILDKQD